MGTTTNKNLRDARVNKNDEFYTTMHTVEQELKHYPHSFHGRTVYCNCDRPGRSEFWNYFHLNFSRLGLKKLIATYLSLDAPSFKAEYTGGYDYDIAEATFTRLNGNGDFSSPECLDILRQCDVVVTNPPFSLARLFFHRLFIADRDFLIISPLNAITYVDVFPFIYSGRVKLGSATSNMTMAFTVPDTYRLVERDQRRLAKVLGDEFVRTHHCAELRSLCWYTTLHFDCEHKQPMFTKHYNPSEYVFYEDYPDVLAVDAVADIPCDYLGPMGVPITYLFRHNPLHYRILNQLDGPILNGKQCFRRIVIQKVVEDF